MVSICFALLRKMNCGRYTYTCSTFFRSHCCSARCICVYLKIHRPAAVDLFIYSYGTATIHLHSLLVCVIGFLCRNTGSLSAWTSGSLFPAALCPSAFPLIITLRRGIIDISIRAHEDGPCFAKRLLTKERTLRSYIWT